MIDKLTIQNFKSIKHMEIDCKRINLLIGEPNTGKSNILESLALFSWRGHRSRIGKFLRFEELSDLFHDGLSDEKIKITLNSKGKLSIELNFSNNMFLVESSVKGVKQRICKFKDFNDTEKEERPVNAFSFLKYYKFLMQKEFPAIGTSYLLPPHGSNLFALAMGKKEISDIMSRFYEEYNLKVMLKTREKKIEIIKQRDNFLISYPYSITSDTLQRMIFYNVAIESNKDSTLIFEEPESFAFPYYTKHLGEKIAFDEDNQYFISTHNPYLLLAILEKSPRDAVKVFITYLQDSQTRVKPLSQDEVTKLMDSEPFFDLGFFLDED